MERLRLALYNKKGMTLIEIMIALLLLAVVSLAVMQTALVGMRTNLQNAERDEAVNIADQRLNELNSRATGTYFNGGTPTIPGGDFTIGPYVEPTISRNFRGFSVNYIPTRNVTKLNATTMQVTMAVSWVYSKQTFTHQVTTIMRKQ
jgi:prepilin-type N-terminal cleavage/methylation domain-containing protein